jgi:hypothetical protein
LDPDPNTIYLHLILQQLQGSNPQQPELPKARRTDKALNIVWFCGLAISIGCVALCLTWARMAAHVRKRLHSIVTDKQQSDVDGYVKYVEELPMRPIRFLVLFTIFLFFIGIMLRFGATSVSVTIIVLGISFVLVTLGVWFGYRNYLVSAE